MPTYKFVVESGLFLASRGIQTSLKNRDTRIKCSVKQLPLFIGFDAPLKSPQKASNTSWLRLFQTKVTYFFMSQKIMLMDETGEILTFGWLTILFVSTPRSCQCVL